MMTIQSVDGRDFLRFRLREFWHRPRIREAKHELVITRDDYQWTEAEANEWLRNLLGDKHFQSLADKAVLDFGCGVGRLSAAALRAGVRRLYAVDVSDSMLRHARSQLPHGEHIEFVLSNGDDCGMIPDNMADVAFSALCFQHMLTFRQAEDCFRSIVNATRPGGTIIIQGRVDGQTEDVGEPTFDGVRIAPWDLDIEGVILANVRPFPGQPKWWIAEYRKCT